MFSFNVVVVFKAFQPIKTQLPTNYPINISAPNVIYIPTASAIIIFHVPTYATKKTWQVQDKSK